MAKTIYSEILQCNVKWEPETKTFKIQDEKDPMFRSKTDYWMRYTLEEAEILKKSGGMDKNIHLIKKMFDGEIIA